jgi:hypothetical protein
LERHDPNLADSCPFSEILRDAPAQKSRIGHPLLSLSHL